MAKINRSIEIRATPEAAFESLINWSALTQWSTVTHSHDGPDLGSGVGDEFDQQVRIAGLPLRTHWRVVEFDRPWSLTYDVTAVGGGRMTLRQEVAPSGEGIRVEFDVDYDLPGAFLGEALDRVYVQRRNEREVEHSLQNLKDLLEGRKLP
ncbi:MAG: SRPBCC family protein [Actinomycetota bacterium]|nr:SRPBCC family protein [Actinomycetota bacterium]